MHRVPGYLAFFFAIVVASCTPTKRIAYFQDIDDSASAAITELPAAKFENPLIRPNDLLQIRIQALNSLENGIDYSSKIPSDGSGQATGVVHSTEFLVDSQGNISLPLIGKMNVNGLTTSMIRDSVEAKMKRYLVQPVVNVRLVNFTVTILGEVSRPANYLLASEKTSILDALGMAGDLTIYGKRENVLLIRASAANRQAVRLNLNSSSIFKSPFFYLKQGDVIYVEPDKSKVTSLDATKTRNYALIASGLSVLIVLLSRINF